MSYTFSLAGTLPAGLEEIRITNDRLLDTFSGIQKKMNDVNHAFSDTGRSITSLKKQMSFLEEERSLLPADNQQAIIGYNNEIRKLNAEINKLENLEEVPWTDQLESAIPGLEKMFNPMDMISSAATKLKQAVSDGLDVWKSQHDEQVRLSAVMHNTMNAGEGEVRSILKLTDAQQKLGVVSRSTQVAGIESLTGNVKQQDSLIRMIPLMNDLTAQQYGVNASKEKATEIAGAFGKIMQGDTGALSQYGIKLTEVQETFIRFGNEASRVAMLEEIVGKAAGGANQALAETPEGRWAQHENGINALLGRIGKLTVQFRNSLFPVIDLFGNLFEKVIVWIESNSATIAAAINEVCSVASIVLGGVFTALSGIIQGFSWWFTALNEGNPLVVSLSSQVALLAGTLGGLYAITKTVAFFQGLQEGATKLLTIAQLALNSAFLTSPLTWIALAIGAVVVAVMVCWNKFEGFRRVVLGVWNVIKEFGVGLYNAVLDPIKKIINGVGILGQAIGQLFAGNFDDALETAKAGAKELTEGLKGATLQVAFPFTAGIEAFKNADIAGAWAQGGEDAKNTGGEGEGFQMPGISDILNLPVFAGSVPDMGNLQPELTMSATTQAVALPANLSIPPAAIPNQSIQINDSQTGSFLEDIMLNVRKIAAVLVLPVALNAQSEAISNAAIQPVLPESSVKVTTQPGNFHLNPFVQPAGFPLNLFTQPATDSPGESMQSTDSQSGYIPKVMMPLHKMSSTIALPVAANVHSGMGLESTEQPGNYSIGMSESYLSGTQGAEGNTIHFDRICEQIVIHVANTDQRGTEEIRSAIYEVLNEIAEA